MKNRQSFWRAACSLAVPVALQSMLQSSFSIVDQIMIGQLGSVSVAGVGLAGKFSSIFSVIISAVGAVAGIMISQYMGQENRLEVRRSFFYNLWLALGIALGFTALCALRPDGVTSLYTQDAAMREEAAAYLALISGTFLPMAGATMLSTLFRCMEKAKLPLYASLFSALLNTVLNYALIFGKWGFPSLGARGAAIATVVSQWANLLLMAALLPKKAVGVARPSKEKAPFLWKQYLSMLLPILVCEVGWSLGENVYAAIYGHMGVEPSAAMALTNPVQGLLIGALCGLSQAAGVIVGKQLGNGEFDEAYASSRKLLWYGAAGAALLSVFVVLLSPLYARIYQVEESVRLLSRQILFAFALVAPFKVLNMILGGGIIRSGGRTKYVMAIDLIGVWLFGVPLGLLAAFVWKLSIPYVYFILSLEECVRFVISLWAFHRKKWMQSLESAEA